MNRYPYKDAKKIIDTIYTPAIQGEIKTREEFMQIVDQHPHIAIQGYNAFGKIFHWNIGASEAYGYCESEAINQDLIDLILPPDMKRLARSMIHTAGKTGRMPDPGPCDLVRKDGQYVTVYSAHLAFKWDDAPSLEFYCLDLLLNEEF